MKLRIILLTLSLYAAVTLGAMSNATALAKAKKLFGPLAGLGTVKGATDTYWTKQVGVSSPGCKDPFTVYGAGLNTWEAAFFKVPTDTVKGPFSGAVTLKNTVYDDKAVTSWQFIFDGVVTSNRVGTPASMVAVQMVWDTRQWANGIHVVCGVAMDGDGNIGRTPAWLVLVDQTKPSIGTTIDFSDKNGRPLVPGM